MLNVYYQHAAWSAVQGVCFSSYYSGRLIFILGRHICTRTDINPASFTTKMRQLSLKLNGLPPKSVLNVRTLYYWFARSASTQTSQPGDCPATDTFLCLAQMQIWLLICSVGLTRYACAQRVTRFQLWIVRTHPDSTKATNAVRSISIGWPRLSYSASTKWKKLLLRRLLGGCFSNWARATATLHHHIIIETFIRGNYIESLRKN